MATGKEKTRERGGLTALLTNTPVPRANPIDVLKEMLLKRGVEINEESFDEAWHVLEEPVDVGLFEAGEMPALCE